MMKPRDIIMEVYAEKLAEKLYKLAEEDKIIEYLNENIGIKNEYCKDILHILQNIKTTKKLRQDDIKKLMKEVNSRCNKFFMLKEHVVEPVRLGEYKSLFFDTYEHVQDKLYIFPHTVYFPDFRSIITHGLLREKTLTLVQGKQGYLSVEEYYYGIDWAVFFHFPIDDEKHYVTVPFFVTAKYDKAGLRKEGFALRRAVKEVLSRVYEPRIRIALEYLPDFTRVAFLRSINYPLNPELYTKPDYIMETCSGRKIDNAVCYSDILAAIIGPVVYDIYQFYMMVLNNDELRVLRDGEWMSALMSLSMPLAVDSYSSPTPPSGYGIGLGELLGRIADIINNNPPPAPAISQQDLKNIILNSMFGDIKNIYKQVRQTRGRAQPA